MGMAGPGVEPASGGATVQTLIQCTTRAPHTDICRSWYMSDTQHLPFPLKGSTGHPGLNLRHVEPTGSLSVEPTVAASAQGHRARHPRSRVVSGSLPARPRSRR